MKRVIIKKENNVYEGTVIQSNDPDTTMLKLDNGYVIGFKEDYEIVEIKEIKPHEEKEYKINQEVRSDIILLHTGGTIASKVDYKTGAVIAGYSPDDIIKRYPELKNLDSRFISNIQSEMMNFNHYNLIANSIKDSIEKGYKGIIITHGTDTMHYTSAALSFVFHYLWNNSDLKKIPIVIVGSQRSSDRPSTDAKQNLIGAYKFIEESIRLGICGVFISMHNSTDDEDIVILNGFNARKMHTSRRDAFKQINNKPFAILSKNKITFLNKLNHDNIKLDKIENKFNPNLKITFLKSHPNMFKEEILFYENYDGLILEGTGLGHFPTEEMDKFTEQNKDVFWALKGLSKKLIIAITPQTIYGRINLSVYSPQRRLRQIGILGHNSDMTPETAFVKLAWLLSNFSKEKAKELYEKNLFGEISNNSDYGGYIKNEF